MAFPKVPASAPSTSRDDSSSSVYSGELIKSLTELVDRVETQYQTPADNDEDIEPEHGSPTLAIDDVLERSGYFKSQNPYVRLLERVLA